MQGKSLWPLLTGETDPHHHKDHGVCEFNDALGSAAIPTPSHASMYFDGRFKHILYHGTGLGELFDLEEDPGEFTNLFADPAHREQRFDLVHRHIDALMATSSAGIERVAVY
jgi:arylsulfatase